MTLMPRAFGLKALGSSFRFGAGSHMTSWVGGSGTGALKGRSQLGVRVWLFFRLKPRPL